MLFFIVLFWGSRIHMPVAARAIFGSYMSRLPQVPWILTNGIMMYGARRTYLRTTIREAHIVSEKGFRFVVVGGRDDDARYPG